MIMTAKADSNPALRLAVSFEKEMEGVDMDYQWYKKGSALLQEIQDTQLPDGLLSLWYIGQMGMVVKWKGHILCLDPVLGTMPGPDGEDRRNYSVPFRSEELKAEYVLCTHAHGDHMHRETLVGMAQANPQLKVILPWSLVETARGFGIPQVQLLGACQDQELVLGDEIRITPVATAHETYRWDAEGHSETLGYLIRLGCHLLFHSGDTIVTPRLVAALRKAGGVDVAMLPINGRDLARNQRNIVGNMNAREACWFAGEIGADLTVPLHYDMIDGNQEDPLIFAAYMERYAPAKKYHIFRLGERCIVS